MMMKYLNLCIFLLVLNQAAFSQKKVISFKTIEKKVLLINNYNELVNFKNNKVLGNNKSTTGIDTISMDMSGDHSVFHFSSYPSAKSLGEEILSKSNFISNDINRNSYLTFYIKKLGKKKGEFNQETELINLAKLPQSNSYFQVKNIPKSMQIWIVNAQWEEYVLNEKDNKTSTYYVLKNIESIAPLNSNLNDKRVKIIKNHNLK